MYVCMYVYKYDYTCTCLAGCALFADVYFFYVHWVLHHRSIYAHVHKKHHKYTSPIAFEAFYFHSVGMYAKQ